MKVNRRGNRGLEGDGKRGEVKEREEPSFRAFLGN